MPRKPSNRAAESVQVDLDAADAAILAELADRMSKSKAEVIREAIRRMAYQADPAPKPRAGLALLTGSLDATPDLPRGLAAEHDAYLNTRNAPVSVIRKPGAANRTSGILQFKVTLTRVKPSVWRRIEVPASYSFWELHVAIQDAMGWTDSHLHAFHVHDSGGKKVVIGIPDEDWFEGDQIYLPGWKHRVTDYLNVAGARAKYEYDFGDDWVHDVRLEAVGPPAKGLQYPRCSAGARKCPPEDCGGPHGYADMLSIIADPHHEEHESTLTWVGGSFDPAEFDQAAVRFDDPAERWKIAFT